ncbi:hypothetical protein BKA62DRAFT_704990 [Auriculariales sp. MPI-PUGE-AT-0066]|nr:hypothetical protein BKA62DRAFT_704990 [Auriculariales sp. MPI-PUGE-AT-0066]
MQSHRRACVLIGIHLLRHFEATNSRERAIRLGAMSYFTKREALHGGIGNCPIQGFVRRAHRLICRIHHNQHGQ